MAPTGSTKTWTVDRASTAIHKMRDLERALVLRLVDARGQRVPVAELSTAFGLPAKPCPAQDFPALEAFCKPAGSSGLEMPIKAEGSDDKGWYWMAAATADKFREGFRKENESLA
jgi:hypothetical protein